MSYVTVGPAEYARNGQWMSKADADAYDAAQAKLSQTPGAYQYNGKWYAPDSTSTQQPQQLQQPASYAVPQQPASYTGITGLTGLTGTSFLNPAVQGTASSNGTVSAGGQTYVPTQNGYVSPQEYDRERLADLQSKTQADAEQRRLGYLSSIIGSQPNVKYDRGGDDTAARAAAFARAKEMAGQNAVASLKSIQDVIANSGMTGSSVDKGAYAGAVSQARGGVNDFIREQLIQDLGRSQHIADVEYQGGLTQRGQNLGTAASLLSAITRAISGPSLY